MTVENKIQRLEEKLDKNAHEIIENMNRLHSCEQKISENSKKIQKNTGALEILHTINEIKKRFFTMWLLTFIILICSICLNICLISK